MDKLDIIAKFITTTYKVSNEQVFIEVELEKLRAKNEEITIKNILLLKTQLNFNLQMKSLVMVIC